MITSSFQMANWRKFIKGGLKEVIENTTYIDDNVTITYELDKDKSHMSSSNYMECLRSNRSYYYSLFCKVNVVTDNTASLFNTDVIPVMDIPYLTDDGFIMNGNKYNLVNTFKLANGWYLEEIDKDGIKKLQASVRTSRGGSFKIRLENRDTVIKCKNNNGKDVSISLLRFAIALTGLDVDELHERVGKDLSSFAKLRSDYDVDELTLDNCIKHVYSKCYNIEEKNITVSREQMLQALKFKFYGGIDLGLDGQIRFKEFISFRKRCSGLQLAESVTLTNGDVISEGMVLMPKTLDEIDADDNIKELIVFDRFNEQTHKVIKYPYTPNMCTNMLLNVLNIFFCYLDGVGELDAKDTLRSKSVETFSAKLSKAIEDRLNVLSREIVKHVHKNLEFNIKDVRFDKYRPDFYINKLKTDKFFQQADDTNSLSLYAGGFKLKSDIDSSSASIQTRDIKPDQYGMVCPFDTSESKEVGTNLVMSSLTRINEAGFLTTPLYKVKNGQKTNELIYVTAYDLLGKTVAFWNEDFSQDTIEARVDGKRLKVSKYDVDYMESSHLQTIGYTASMIPGVENQKSKRVVMGVNMYRQSIPVCKGERPRHSSGAPTRDAGILRVADFVEIIIEQEDCENLRQELIDYGIEIVKLVNDIGLRIVHFKSLHPDFSREYSKPILFLQGSLSNTLKSYMLKEPKKLGVYIYRGSEIVFHMNDVDVKEYDFRCSDPELLGDNFNKDCDFALGYNFRVLYKCLRGYTYEDAFVVAKSVVDSQVFSSVKIKSYVEELVKTDEMEDSLASRDSDLGFKKDIYGLPVKGSFIKGGQTLAVIKRTIYKKQKVANGKYKMTNNVEKVISLPIKSDVGDDGYVISTSLVNNKLVIMTATLQDLHVGDKLSGRQGNKGVIGKIVDDLDMPFDEDGLRPQIIVNPLGILARGNPGQLQDALAGLLGVLNNCIYLTPQYSDKNYDFIIKEAEKAGIKPKRFYDGITGRCYPTKMVMGVLFLEKLNHLVESKFLATGSSTTNINPETLQPKQGKKAGGGQRISELSNWSMTAAGGIGALQDFQSIQCTDLETRRLINKCLMSGDVKPDISGDNLSSMRLLAMFKALGVNVESSDKGYSFSPVTDEYIVSHSTKIELDPNIDPFLSLHSKEVFPDGNKANLTFVSKTSRRLWGHIDLNTKLIMPWFLTSEKFLNNFYIRIASYDSVRDEISVSLGRMSSVRYKALVEQKAFIDVASGTYYSDMKIWDSVVADSNSELYTGAYALIKYLNTYSKERLEELGYDTKLLFYSKEEEENLDKIGNVYTRGITVPKKKHMELGGIPKEDNDQKLTYKYQKYRSKVRYINPQNYMVSKMLILPTAYRPKQGMRDEYHTFDKLYKNLIIKLKDTYTEQQFNTMYSYLTTIQGNVKDDKNGASGSLIPIGARILSSKLDKKSTELRGNIHGFRVMNSGRSVIVGNPKLSVYTYGLPYPMALEKYRSHLIGYLKSTKNEYYQLIMPKYVNKVLDCLASGDIEAVARYIVPEMTAQLTPKEILDLCHEIDENIFNALAQRILSEKDVINREPSLHKFNLKALTPILVRGFAIELPPVHCPSFNADHDGDTMMSATPNSRQGQESLAEGMSVENNIINPKDNSIILTQAQDIILGLYQLTAYRDNLESIDKWAEFTDRYYTHVETIENDLELDLLKPHEIVIVKHKGRMYCNTAGRLVFASKLPNGFSDKEEPNNKGFYQITYDKQVTKKVMSAINEDIVHNYTAKEFLVCLDKVKNLGFLWSDFSGFTISAYDFQYKRNAVELIREKAEEKEDLLRQYQNLHLIPSKGNSPAITSLWGDAIENIENAITYPISVDEDDYTDLYDIVSANATAFEEMLRVKCKETKIQITPTDIFNLYKQYGGKGSVENIDKGLSNVADSITSTAVELRIDYPTEYERMLLENFVYICLRLKEGLQRDSSLFRLIDSGARGSFSNYSQCVGIVGQVTTSSNEIIENPLKGSYISGIDIYESFNDGFFARKGIISSAILTQESGTLTKYLITLCQSVTVEKEDCGANAFTLRLNYVDLKEDCQQEISSVVSETGVTVIENCDDKSLIGLHMKEGTFEALAKSFAKTVTIGGRVIQLRKKLDEAQAGLMKGRVFQMPSQQDIERYNLENELNDIQNIGSTVTKYIDKNTLNQIENKALNYFTFRSSLECNCKKGVCQTCYGEYEGLNKPPKIGTFIGMISAQALGEPSTQLTLDTNHGKASDTSVTGSVNKVKSFVSASAESRGDKEYIYSLKDNFFRNFNSQEIQSQLDLKFNYYIKNIELGVTSLQTVEHKLDEYKDSYINRYQPLTPAYRFQDLMLLDYNSGRFKLLSDYYHIYADKTIKINPVNFEIVVRQQTKFWLITETIGDLPESSVVTYDMLKERNLVPNITKDSSLFAYPLWCSHEESAKFSGDALTYISSSRVRDHMNDCVVNHFVDDGKSVLSAQTVGANLVTRKIKNLKEYEPLPSNVTLNRVAVEEEVTTEKSEGIVEGIQDFEITETVFKDVNKQLQELDTSEYQAPDLLEEDEDDDDFNDNTDLNVDFSLKKIGEGF